MDRSRDPIPALASVYAAGLDNDRWRDALAVIVEDTGASGAQLMLADRAGRRSLLSAGIDPAENARYNDHYGRLDPIPAKLSALAEGAILSCREAIGGDARRSAFFAEWADPNQISDAAFVKLSGRAAPLWALALGHPQRDRPFVGRALRAYLDLLAPHLVNAISIARRLDQAGADGRACESSFDHLGCGWMLLTGARRLQRCNGAARVMLDMTDGFRLRSGTVELTDPAANARFARAVQAAAGAGGHFGCPLAAPRASGTEPYLVRIMPHQTPDARFGGGSDQVTMVITDPAQDERAIAAILKSSFGLTEAETNVAVKVRLGGGLRRVAVEHRVSLSTARIHLQRVFEKTGTHRQSELVMFMQRLLPRP